MYRQQERERVKKGPCARPVSRGRKTSRRKRTLGLLFFVPFITSPLQAASASLPVLPPVSADLGPPSRVRHMLIHMLRYIPTCYHLSQLSYDCAWATAYVNFEHRRQIYYIISIFNISVGAETKARHTVPKAKITEIGIPSTGQDWSDRGSEVDRGLTRQRMK